MPKLFFIKLFFVFILFFCGLSKKENLKFKNEHDPCVDVKDTIIRFKFAKDTNTTDFFKMLKFIESKGEFSRYNKKNKISSSIGNSIILTKLLCPGKEYKSPTEIYVFDDVYSIRYYMTSKKSIIKNDKFYPKFDITQHNFKTEEEKEIALKKIKEIGWGDPFRKWNDYYIVHSKKRIIILESYVTMFGEIKNKYGKMIQENWIDKNNN
jgi:hypothetical protein